MKIQAPTLGRIVLYTDELSEHPGIVWKMGIGSLVSIHVFRTFPEVLHDVPFNADGEAGTWRYPPRSDVEIEVG